VGVAKPDERRRHFDEPYLRVVLIDVDVTAVGYPLRCTP
jgi:hypothetical protein